jgi:serine/threonine-protein kinase
LPTGATGANIPTVDSVYTLGGAAGLLARARAAIQPVMSILESSPMTAPRGRDIPKKIFDYEVLDHIGEGARSQIYVVSDPKTRQIYALKHVKRETEKDERFIQQVQNEFDVGTRVNHPNLRRPVEIKYARNLLLKVTEAALVLELFDGQPLDKTLPRKLGPMLVIFLETAKALEAMHAQGFVHCDLKPINIMISPSGHVKVIDLGQAAPVGTEKKRIQGTPDYIAPEQVKCRPVGVRTDIYNLGATMYWALTKKNVPTLYTYRKQARNPSFDLDRLITSPHKLNPHVPEALSNLVCECVRSDPRQRPGDMTEVIRRLNIIEHTVHKQHRASLSLEGRGQG